jgi:mono/diheme cytochrome c family protein
MPNTCRRHLLLLAVVACGLSIIAYAIGPAMQTAQSGQPPTQAQPNPGDMGHMEMHEHHTHQHHPNVALPKGDSEHGAQLFQQKNCAKCHATEANTKSFGPNLYGIFNPKIHGHRMTQGDVVYQIRHGGGKMPPYASQLTKQQLADVVAYLRTLQLQQ